jgi:hypothetical protein
MIVTQRAAGPIPEPMTSCRYMLPGIMRKPMNTAPTTVFQSKPSSKWSGALSRSRYSFQFFVVVHPRLPICLFRIIGKHKVAGVAEHADESPRSLP